MTKHDQPLSITSTPPDPAEDPTVLQLRERVSELELENASLRHLDETIRRNARLFEALVSRSRDGAFLITPQMTFLKVIHSVLGNTDQTLAGRSLLSIMHPEDRARVGEAFSALLEAPGQSVVCDCRSRDQNGEWRWMEVEMTDMLDDPDVQAIVLNNRDITERKKCQETAAIAKSPRCCGSCLEHKC
jgi:PAS domain S-box-containing protein